jgi:hypothetical protein
MRHRPGHQHRVPSGTASSGYAILDCSSVPDPDKSRAEARKFIEMMATTELAYDFVFREIDSQAKTD